MKKLWLAGIATLNLSLIFACMGVPPESSDIVIPGPADSSEPDDTEEPGELTVLPDPCAGTGAIMAVRFTSDDVGWCGCDNGGGLHYTEDAGDSFEEDNTLNDLYVSDIEQDGGDAMLICGHHGPTEDDGLLYRGTLNDWKTLLSAGGEMDSCGAVAAAGDGTMIVVDTFTKYFTCSLDNGSNWAEEEKFEKEWKDSIWPYDMQEMVAEGGRYHAAGSNIDLEPAFYGPSDDTDANNFQAHVIDTFEGRVSALASSDGGTIWFAGGPDQSVPAPGFLYRSEDTGEKWEAIPLGDEIGIVKAIAFDESGTYGVAVGEHSSSAEAGFVLLTRDGGVTWPELEEETGPLYSAAVFGDTYWVAGDGYLARGTFY